MDFKDKLIFLMDITHTSNINLASILNVDPSLISLLRTGRRKLPRHQNHLEKISAYLAERLKTEFQLQQLSEAMNFRNLKANLQTISMADLLAQWLSGNVNYNNDINTLFQNLPNTNTDKALSPNPLLTEFMTYTGNSGKLKALLDCMNHLLTLPNPATIYVYSDENPEWYLDNITVTQKLFAARKQLVEKGWKFVHILPPSNHTDFFGILGRWLHLYVDDTTQVYYYPKRKDFTFRRTCFIVPDVVSLYSPSIWNNPKSHMTYVTTAKPIIESYFQLIQDFLKLCKPSFKVYRDRNNLNEFMQRYLHPTAQCSPHWRKSLSLSLESMPVKEVLTSVGAIGKYNASALELFTIKEEERANRYKDFSSNDFCFLATPQQIKEGKIPIVILGIPIGQNLYYTPEAYCIHLKHIIHMLKTYENYHFIPLPFTERDNEVYDLCENQYAYLLRKQEPVTILDIYQLDIVDALQEKLMDIADSHGFSDYTPELREKVIKQLQAVIDELEA